MSWVSLEKNAEIAFYVRQFLHSLIQIYKLWLLLN